MKKRLGIAVVAGLLLALPAGCALLQPLPVDAEALAARRREIDDRLDKVSELLEQAAREVPATQKSDASRDEQEEALTLITGVLQQLRADLANAPTTEAQQQAALQAAQSAAVTFGGQYGGLIAAGLGILSVLVQGVMNTNKAHQSAKVANETAQVLAGRLPPLSR
jgi:hypothetical protein